MRFSAIGSNAAVRRSAPAPSVHGLPDSVSNNGAHVHPVVRNNRHRSKMLRPGRRYFLPWCGLVPIEQFQPCGPITSTGIDRFERSFSYRRIMVAWLRAGLRADRCGICVDSEVLNAAERGEAHYRLPRLFSEHALFIF